MHETIHPEAFLHDTLNLPLKTSSPPPTRPFCLLPAPVDVNKNTQLYSQHTKKGFRQSDDLERAANPFIISTRVEPVGEFSLQLEGVNAPGTPLGTGEVFVLPTPVTARFVRIEAILAESQWISLNEVLNDPNDPNDRGTLMVFLLGEYYVFDGIGVSYTLVGIQSFTIYILWIINHIY